MLNDDETQQPDSIAIVEELIEQLRRFNLTPDDRATLELIRADIETARQAAAVQPGVPEIDAATVTVSRDLLVELRAIAQKYA
ncbi:hypothetical protein EB73_08350 [Mycobacterium sp. SWH-M3]|nr:hypothetical protein EB73_08350 [Mycobacterium sp. SWH-M3]